MSTSLEEKWEKVGTEMPYIRAYQLFKDLTVINISTEPYPLALVTNGNEENRKGKVITSMEEKGDWQVILANAVFLFGKNGQVTTNDDPTVH